MTQILSLSSNTLWLAIGLDLLSLEMAFIVGLCRMGVRWD